MAFDIYISDLQDNNKWLLHLYIDEYDFITEKLETLDTFPNLKISLSDYYGDHELYLEDLPKLKSEVLAFTDLYKSSFTESVKDFFSQFIRIINHAIAVNRTIKFVGD